MHSFQLSGVEALRVEFSKTIEGIKGISALNAPNKTVLSFSYSTLVAFGLLLLFEVNLAIEELLGCDEHGLGNTLVVL